MDGGNEQRVAITFCFKAGVSATETLVLVQKAYGNEALNQSNIFRWYSPFWDWRELVEDDDRGGCPKLTWTEVNIAAVADWSEMTIESHQEWWQNTVVLWILKEDLGKRKLCACFVPLSLTPEQREDQVTSCQDIIGIADADKIFLNKIITRDEMWFFACDPETKREF